MTECSAVALTAADLLSVAAPTHRKVSKRCDRDAHLSLAERCSPAPPHSLTTTGSTLEVPMQGPSARHYLAAVVLIVLLVILAILA